MVPNDPVNPVGPSKRSYDLISVNDHLVLPPTAFVGRLPEKYSPRAPRVIEGGGSDGRKYLAMKGLATADLDAAGVKGLDALSDTPGDAWDYDGRVFPTSGTSVLRRYDAIDFRDVGSFRYSELPAWFTDSKARLEILDRDGILASACFPLVEFPSYAGQYFLMSDDREYSQAVVCAYNDFVLEEWVGAAPDRYIGVIVLPVWDPRASAVEIERTAALGARAITFPEDPSKLGLPSIQDRSWDPVFRAAEETSMPLCLHIGSSSWLPPMAPDVTMAAGFAIAGALTPITFFDWLMSDVLFRFPELKIVLTEGNIGWIPWALWRADYVWERHSGWGGRKTPEPPSRYFHSNVFGCALPFESSAASTIDTVGSGRFMFETDYPHPDMSYPDTSAMLAKTLATLDDEEVEAVLRSNAKSVFNL
jgi:predicted TIM-barrel fold metal-dependent hydrolase